MATENESQKLCRVCDKAIPSHGRKCTECNSFQDWRRFLSFSTEVLAMIIALLSVLGIAIPAFTRWLNRHSHTQVRIVGASDDDLLVIAMNTGGEPSTVYRFRATFLKVPIGDADLVPLNPSELLIPAAGSGTIHLRPRRFTPKPGCNAEILAVALRDGTLNLTAYIKESTDERTSDLSQRQTEYPTANLSSWIKTYIPSE